MDIQSSVTSLLSILTILGQGIVIILLALLLKSLFSKKENLKLNNLIEKYGLLFMFIVALIAMSGSLTFSEIIGFVPCRDCWFQRIFMYPQSVLLLIALWKHDKNIARYILALCSIGILFSIYQYYGQVSVVFNPTTSAVCDASGVSCSDAPFFYFGYITIPLMTLTAFAMNIVTSILIIRQQKNR